MLIMTNAENLAKSIILKWNEDTGDRCFQWEIVDGDKINYREFILEGNQETTTVLNKLFDSWEEILNVYKEQISEIYVHWGKPEQFTEEENDFLFSKGFITSYAYYFDKYSERISEIINKDNFNFVTRRDINICFLKLGWISPQSNCGFFHYETQEEFCKCIQEIHHISKEKNIEKVKEYLGWLLCNQQMFDKNKAQIEQIFKMLAGD